MIATRGFGQTPLSSRVRLSLRPIDAEALRVGHLRIPLVPSFALVCRGCRIPCSNCSFSNLRIAMNSKAVKGHFTHFIVYRCAPRSLIYGGRVPGVSGGGRV